MIGVLTGGARLRFVTWNCGGGFPRKAAALLSLRPDVALVAEVAMPERWPAPLGALAALAPRLMFWAGADPNKGLLMLSFGDCVLERLADETATSREEIYASARKGDCWVECGKRRQSCRLGRDRPQRSCAGGGGVGDAWAVTVVCPVLLRC